MKAIDMMINDADTHVNDLIYVTVPCKNTH